MDVGEPVGGLRVVAEILVFALLVTMLVMVAPSRAYAQAPPTLEAFWKHVGGTIDGPKNQYSGFTNVALSSTGEHMVVAVGNDSLNRGLFRVYDQTPDDWIQFGRDFQGILQDGGNGPFGEQLGSIIAINATGTIIAIGSSSVLQDDGTLSGRVQMFHRNGGQLVQLGPSIQGKVLDIDLSYDGQVVAITSLEGTQVFRLSDKHEWRQVGGPLPAGTQVALNGNDGTVVAMGFRENVWVYRLGGGVWLPPVKEIDDFGHSPEAIELSADGGRIAIQSEGQVQLYQPRGDWEQIGIAIPGAPFSMNDAGSVLTVGGRVHEFERTRARPQSPQIGRLGWIEGDSSDDGSTIALSAANGSGLINVFELAYRAIGCPPSGGNFSAGTEQELEVAIRCYNQLGLSGIAHTVIMTDDIQLTKQLPYINSLANPAAPLVIVGAGFTLSGEPNGRAVLRQVAGDLTLRNLTVSEGEGAGVHVSAGSAAIIGSTLTGNEWGIIIETSSVIVRNSTIAHNDDSGIYVKNSGTALVEQTTVAFNRGHGIENEGSVTVSGSLFAGNDDDDCDSARLAIQPGNVFEDASCGGPATPDIVTGLTSALGDNECALTACSPTLALLPGSAAVNVDTACAAGLDQRGASRVAGRCDAGAFELWESLTPPPVELPPVDISDPEPSDDDPADTEFSDAEPVDLLDIEPPIAARLARIDRDGSRAVVYLTPGPRVPPEGRYRIHGWYLDPATAGFKTTGRWTPGGAVTNGDLSLFSDSFENLNDRGLVELGVYLPTNVRSSELRLSVTDDGGTTTIISVPLAP